MRQAGLIALALLALAGGARAESPPSVVDEAARVTAAAKALEPHTDGAQIDDTPGAPALLTGYWDAVHGWAAAWLWSHSNEKPVAVAAAGKAFDDIGEWQAIQLDANDILIAASIGEQGEVFILHHAAGSWTLAWSLTSWAASRSPPDPLSAWSPSRSRDGCRTGADEAGWWICGALRGRLGKLPPDRHGRPRFFIDAYYAQVAGAQIGGQVSIWAWTGGAAVPQYVNHYALTIEQDEGVRAKGDRLLIREKSDFKSFFTCNSCLGRQMEHTVRLTPDGVTDLGRVSLRPDLDLVDGVMDRLLSGKQAGPAASPKAAAVLTAALAGPRARRLADPKTGTDLGMQDGWTLKRSGATRELCLVTDENTFVFRLAGSGRGARIVGVALRAGDCGKSARF